MKIKLTPAQIEWVEWALDPMLDSAQFNEDCDYALNDVPRLFKNELTLYASPAAIEDLLYRLEQQAPDVANTDSISEQQVAARTRSALNAADKIRRAGLDQ